MSHNLGPAVKSIPLDEPVVRLAEQLASRYSVTVPQFVEAVLIDWAEREMQGETFSSALGQRQPMRPGRRVIDIGEARRRRRWL